MRNFILPALLAGVIGCGGGPNVVPVSGKVVYDDGQPAVELAGGTVVFDDGKVSAVGEIKPDATFTLSFGETDDGAIPGEYKVTVRPNENYGQDEKRPPRPIPAEFGDPEQTPLRVTVTDGNNNPTLTVTRAKRR